MNNELLEEFLQMTFAPAKVEVVDWKDAGTTVSVRRSDGRAVAVRLAPGHDWEEEPDLSLLIEELTLSMRQDWCAA